MRAVILSALVVVLYVLHQDFWFWRVARPLVFGFLPVGLFYHIAFTVASSVLMWLLVKYSWPAHLEKTPSPERRPALQVGRSNDPQ